MTAGHSCVAIIGDFKARLVHFAIARGSAVEVFCVSGIILMEIGD